MNINFNKIISNIKHWCGNIFSAIKNAVMSSFEDVKVFLAKSKSNRLVAILITLIMFVGIILCAFAGCNSCNSADDIDSLNGVELSATDTSRSDLTASDLSVSDAFVHETTKSDILVSEPTTEPTATTAATESSVTYRLLTIGSSGTDVVRLQKRLIELGYLSDSADGIYGDATAKAVKRFQIASGLGPDGIAGRTTQTAIYAKNAIAYSSVTSTAKPTTTTKKPVTTTVKSTTTTKKTTTTGKPTTTAKKTTSTTQKTTTAVKSTTTTKKTTTAKPTTTTKKTTTTTKMSTTTKKSTTTTKKTTTTTAKSTTTTTTTTTAKPTTTTAKPTTTTTTKKTTTTTKKNASGDYGWVSSAVVNDVIASVKSYVLSKGLHWDTSMNTSNGTWSGASQVSTGGYSSRKAFEDRLKGKVDYYHSSEGVEYFNIVITKKYDDGDYLLTLVM